MRIPCFFKEGRFEAAYIKARFESETLHIYATIEFLIDTGAFRTIVNDKDARELGVDYQELEKLQGGVLGVGGSVDAHILKNAKLVFKTENKRLHSECFESLCFLKHSFTNERMLKMPSLMGRDIINKFALRYDKRFGQVYLTDEKALK